MDLETGNSFDQVEYKIVTEKMPENPLSEEDISEIKEPEPDPILGNEDFVRWIKRERFTLKCYKEIADVQT